MGREIVTACMFCLLCATHAHCSSSHDVGGGAPEGGAASHDTALRARADHGGGGGTITQLYHNLPPERQKRSDDEDFVRSIFQQFGNGETISKAGFERLLESLGFSQSHDDNHADHHTSRHINDSTIQRRCNGGAEGLLGTAELLTRDKYRELCPKLVDHLVRYQTQGCGSGRGIGKLKHQPPEDHSHDDPSATSSQTAVWVYASVSVVMISLCGLLAVAVIPLMHSGIYQSLLQFLVALAVGTLCGDALLHLLPHAMMSTHSHDSGDDDRTGEDIDADQHTINLWRGLVAALAIVFFYFTEKCLSMIAEWRKRKQRKNAMNTTRVRVMRDEVAGNEGRVGEKLCKHKYSSYPYCYGEITINAVDGINSGNANNIEVEVNSIANIKEENGASNPIIINHRHDVDNEGQKEDVPSSEKQLLETSRDGQSDYTMVILREHETRHHGHAHTHGHVHSAPRSLGSVAWMVVLGDGLHNFTDGLAIGAAFASNIGGGVSTAVAVFCHELPHELGDFAVLLKAGMSAKQAVFYNLLSSVLCLFGMCLGVMLGHSETTTLWVFSAAAGMFLYIALVDMIPELTSSHSTEGGSIVQGILQLTGLVTGLSTMLLIALYEQDLRVAFKNSF